jgi:hypothetical protein
MGLYRLGRLPAVRPAALSDLAVYAKGKLPAPPASVAVPAAQGGYPLDGNATYGDCTIAGVAHLIGAWNAEVKQADPVPDANAVIAEYFQLTGGPDSGLNENFVLSTWYKDGLFGEKIAGYAPVDHTSILKLHQAVAFYGGAYLGIVCSESCQQQFAANEPWTYVPNSPIEGGHCIVALGYTANGLLCATWGGIAEVTYSFLAHYLDEAWVVLPHQFVQAKGDALGIDLVELQKDLRSV